MECGGCAKNCPEEAISVNPGVGCAAAIIAGWISVLSRPVLLNMSDPFIFNNATENG